MTSDPPKIEDIDHAPDRLKQQPQESVPAAEHEALRAKYSEVATARDELSEQVGRLKQSNKTAAKLDKLIEPYAWRTFVFMCVYCLGVALLLLLQAFGYFSVPMSDGVIQILVGSTAATVLGLVGMVLTGIFVGARRR